MFEFSILRLHRMDKGGALKAFCDVNINGKIQIKGFKVFEGKEGGELFLGLPSELGKNGKWFQTVTMADDVKNELSQLVLEAYNEQVIEV